MKPPSKKPEDKGTFQGKWKETVIPIPEPQKCTHYFEWQEGECRCRGCHMGLMGVVDIKDGRPI